MRKKAWTIDAVQKIASTYQTRLAFRKGDSGAYQAAHRNLWLDRVCHHMSRPPKASFWTEESIQEEALKFKTRFEFSKNSNRAYKAAHRNGLLDVVCSHMTTDRNPTWTKELVLEEAKKYNTLIDFYRGSSGAYQASHRKGWTVEVNNLFNHAA